MSDSTGNSITQISRAVQLVEALSFDENNPERMRILVQMRPHPALDLVDTVFSDSNVWNAHAEITFAIRRDKLTEFHI